MKFETQSDSLEKSLKPPLWLYFFGIFPAPAICFAQMTKEWLDFESGGGESPDLRILALTAILPAACAVFAFVAKLKRGLLIGLLVVANIAALGMGQWLLLNR